MNSMMYNYDDADRDPGYETTECPDCEGTGYTWDPFFIHDAIRCKRCDGKGTIYIES